MTSHRTGPPLALPVRPGLPRGETGLQDGFARGNGKRVGARAGAPHWDDRPAHFPEGRGPASGGISQNDGHGGFLHPVGHVGTLQGPARETVERVSRNSSCFGTVRHRPRTQDPGRDRLPPHAFPLRAVRPQPDLQHAVRVHPGSKGDRGIEGYGRGVSLPPPRWRGPAFCSNLMIPQPCSGRLRRRYACTRDLEGCRSPSNELHGTVFLVGPGRGGLRRAVREAGQSTPPGFEKSVKKSSREEGCEEFSGYPASYMVIWT